MAEDLVAGTYFARVPAASAPVPPLIPFTIGRDADIATIEHALRAAPHHRPFVCVLSGAGQGQSELVDTLLLDGGVERPGTLWVGDTPSQVATDAERLRGLGSEPVAQVPVDAALLAAAAASGAAFEPLGGGRTGLVGKPVEDGVAALLRYPLVTHQGP